MLILLGDKLLQIQHLTLLAHFSIATGLQINYQKSTFVPINVPGSDAAFLAADLGCAISTFPQSYLGLLLSNTKGTYEHPQFPYY